MVVLSENNTGGTAQKKGHEMGFTRHNILTAQFECYQKIMKDTNHNRTGERFIFHKDSWLSQSLTWMLLRLGAWTKNGCFVTSSWNSQEGSYVNSWLIGNILLGVVLQHAFVHLQKLNISCLASELRFIAVYKTQVTIEGRWLKLDKGRRMFCNSC